MSDVKKKLVALVAEADPNELACRIAEAAIGVKRPKGVTAHDAMKVFPDEERAGFYKAAERATEYIIECINAGQVPS